MKKIPQREYRFIWAASRHEVHRMVPVDRSKYTPHQGKRECARRVRQSQVR